MAGKKKFEITSPRSSTFKTTTQSGKVNAELTWSSGFSKKTEDNLGRAQSFVDSECLRLMNPLTPRLTGMMIKSGTIGTVIGSGHIEYASPYARRQYYENSGSNGQRGKLWFERMKAAHRDSIVKGANRIAGGN